MKKRISLLICMLIASLACLTGCGSKEPVSVDQMTTEQFAQWMIAYCTSIDDESADAVRNLRESVFEQQLAQNNMPITTEAFIAAMDAWDAGEDECGAYISNGEYTFEAGTDEVKVTTEAQFENRDATIEFIFDENGYLDSLTVSAHFSIGEILAKAGLNTLLGMGTVFAVLILISLIISLFKYIPAIQEKFTKKPEVKEETVAPVAEEAAEDVTDDTELIAVIAAAIAAAEGTTTDGFVVRSIKRRKSNKWN